MAARAARVKTDRSRMIVDVAPEIQMAIRLRSIKAGKTTGDVVVDAIEQCFPEDMKEARAIHQQRKQSEEPCERS